LLIGLAAGFFAVAPILAPSFALSHSFGVTWVSLAYYVLVANRDVVARVFEVRWLGYVGRRSYAVYLLHAPVIAYLSLRLMPGHPVVFLGGCLVITFALAELSWRIIERPFLRLKARPSATYEADTVTPSAPGALELPAISN
jgi:peptidoglycan/LPS O-acetylase OafA/YrhL